MSTSTTTTTTSGALPSVKVAKPFARTASTATRSKVIPKVKTVPAKSDSSSTVKNTTMNKITKSQDKDADLKATGRPGAKIVSAPKETSAPVVESHVPVKAKLPSTAPFDIRKIRAFIAERPDLQDLRKSSTSTVGSTNSTSSIMSRASSTNTASSFETGSIASTETIKPPSVKRSVQPKVFPSTASKSSSQNTKKIRLPTKKSSSTTKNLVKDVSEKVITQAVSEATNTSRSNQVMAPKLEPKTATKKVVKKKKTILPSSTTDEQPQTVAGIVATPPSKNKVTVDSLNPTKTTTKLETLNPAETTTKLENAQNKNTKLSTDPGKSTDVPSDTAIVPPRKKKALASGPAAAGDVIAPKVARKKPKSTISKSDTQIDTLSSTTSAQSVSVPKLKSTVAKTVEEPKPKSTTILDKSAVTTMKPAKAVARRAVSAPIPPGSMSSNSQKTEAHIPPTPNMSRISGTKNISDTPLPNKIQRPRTDAPLTRRKSVSFKYPLEAFQIIPARKPSRSPPRSARKKVSMGDLPVRSALPTVKEQELRPSTPFAVPDRNDDDNDLVFQGEEDPEDRLALGLPVPAKDVVSSETFENLPEPDQPPDNTSEADEHIEANRNEATSSATDLEAEETNNLTTSTGVSDEQQAALSSAVGLQAEKAVAEAEPEIEAFDPETVPDSDEDEDDSTVFYDADESYVPQHISPHKSLTSRSLTGTPLGSMTVKLAKSPRSVTENGSPKLDLLRLCTPTKKRKVKKSTPSASGGNAMCLENTENAAKSLLDSAEL